MKSVFIVLAITLSSIAFAQDSNVLDKCSKSLAGIENSLNSLDESQVHTLLSAVNSTCLSSVEFSEWANELLYTVAIEYPAYFVKSFSWQPQEIQSNIIKELESPIHDGIDLNKAYQSVQSVSGGAEKARILLAIKAAVREP